MSLVFLSTIHSSMHHKSHCQVPTPSSDSALAQPGQESNPQPLDFQVRPWHREIWGGRNHSQKYQSILIKIGDTRDDIVFQSITFPMLLPSRSESLLACSATLTTLTTLATLLETNFWSLLSRLVALLLILKTRSMLSSWLEVRVPSLFIYLRPLGSATKEKK